MLRKLFFVNLLILFFMLSVSMLYSLGSDFSARFNVEFNINKTGNDLPVLTSNYLEEYIYLTERATEINKFQVKERFYAPISELIGKYGKKKLKKDNYSWKYNVTSDVFISDYKIHTLTFPKERSPGDQVNISYREEYDEFAYFPIITIPGRDSLEAYNIIINHPKDFNIEFEFFFPRDEPSYNIDRSDPGKTGLSFGGLKQLKKLPYFAFSDIYAVILTKIFRNGKLLNPVDCESFTSWYEKKTDLSYEFIETDSLLITDKLFEGNNNLEQLKSIYDYLSLELRYICDNEGIHSFFPHAPEEVLANKYGDCKDIAYLISSLAKKQGIKVNMALMSTNQPFTLDGVHLNLFNHVICAYLEGEQYFFFDPVAKYCDFYSLPGYDTDVKVMIMDPENPHFEFIDKCNNLPDIEIEITVNPDSLQVAQALITLHNDDYLSAVSAVNELTKLEAENFLIDLLSSTLNKILIDNFRLKSQAENTIIFNARADLSNFVISSSTKKYIRKTPFVVFERELLDRKDDDYPLYFSCRKKLDLTILIEALGYKVEKEQFCMGDMHTSFFQTTAQNMESHQIKLTYSFNRDSKIMKDAEKYEFLELAEQYLKNKKNMYELKKEKE